MLERLTPRRAALAAALAAVLVYLPAPANRFALDDSPIVEHNPAAHSIGSALRAFDDPYWPPEHAAGLWRPLVILSFAVDYQLSGGSTAWLHTTNVVLHAGVSALLVLVLGAWLPAGAALAAGLLFAAHPVHVEAVANLVGRAELLVALFLLGAVLLDRRLRVRPSLGLEIGLLALVMAALLSKEHGVIAVPLLMLDRLAAGPADRRPLPFAAAGLTVAWFFLRRLVEGGAGFDAVAPTFIGLDAWGRFNTMMAAFLALLRLMVWPFDLSPDYHPMIIERLTHPTPASVIGAAAFAALIALALLLWRSQRAIAAGLLLAGLAWFPTSNLLVPTGIVLSERTLYLPSAGVVLALVAGWLAVARGRGRPQVVIAVVLLLWGARTVTRVPAWKTTQALVVTSLLAHPESYKVHQSAARVFIRIGDRAGAQREYRTAAAIFAGDPYMLSEAAVNALELGRRREAQQLLRESEKIDSTHFLTQQLLARLALERGDAAGGLAHARRAVAGAPQSAESARMAAAAFVALGLPDSAHAVWPAFEARGGAPFDAWLLRAATFAATSHPDSARQALERAQRLVPDDSTARRRLAQTRGLIEGNP